MVITKKHIKILRYVRRRKSLPYSSLYKFDISYVDELIASGYIICGREIIQDEDGFDIGGLQPQAPCSLSKNGFFEVEQHDWFDLNYVITQIVLPAGIGIGAAVVTEIIIRSVL